MGRRETAVGATSASKCKKAKTHRMGAMDNEPLEEYSSDLLLDKLRISLGEEQQHQLAKEASMRVGETEMVCHGRKQVEASLAV